MLRKVRKFYKKFQVSHSPQINLVWGFFLYILTGFLLLCLPLSQKVDVNILDNLFIATSAVSTTGLVTVSVSDSYNYFGQLVVMLLFQIGGIGYMTLTTYYLLSTTSRITHWHEKLINTEFAMPASIKINDFIKSVIVFTLIMETLGAICFFIAFKQAGLSTSHSIWSGIFHSISAFCTAGFGLYNNSFEDYQNNYFINIIISVLAISGSIGFIFITDVWYRITGKTKELSFTTKIVGCGFLILLSLGTVTVYFSEPAVQLNGDAPLLKSFFQAMTAMTTVGFNTIATGDVKLHILMMIILLMYIGASPSGTAGGMKITTFTAIIAILKSRLKGDKGIYFLNRRIPFERLYVATATFIFYTSLIFIGTILLTYSEKDALLDTILFEVASALGTVGLSAGITGSLTTVGKIVIILTMFIGRVGVITFGFALFARRKKIIMDESLEGDLAV